MSHTASQQQWQQYPPKTWQHGQNVPPKQQQPAGSVNLGDLLDKYFLVRGESFLRDMKKILEEHDSNSPKLRPRPSKPTNLVESKENVKARDSIEQALEKIAQIHERIEQTQGRLEEINRKAQELNRKVEEIPDAVATIMQPAAEKRHQVVMELKEKLEAGLNDIIKTELNEALKFVQAAPEVRQDEPRAGRVLNKNQCQSSGVGSRVSRRRKSERLKIKRRENPVICHSCKTEFKLENGNKRRNGNRRDQNTECLSCGEPVHMCIKCIRRVYRHA